MERGTIRKHSILATRASLGFGDKGSQLPCDITLGRLSYRKIPLVGARLDLMLGRMHSQHAVGTGHRPNLHAELASVDSLTEMRYD